MSTCSVSDPSRTNKHETLPRLTAAEQGCYCARCRANCEQIEQTKHAPMTELTTLCSLRQAERNPYAQHKDSTISQLAGGAANVTAEPFKSCHLQNRKDVTVSSRASRDRSYQSSNDP